MSDTSRRDRARPALRRLRRLLGTAGCGIVVFTAALALLSLGGAFSRRLDMISNLAPVYAGVGFLGLLAVLATRRHIGLAAAAAAALAVGGWQMAPEFRRDTGPTAPPGAPGQIKVIQLNALRTNRQIVRIADWIAAERPDVVMTTETRHDLRDLLRSRGWKVAGFRGDLMIFTRQPYLVMHRPRFGHDPEVNFVNATYATASGPAEFATVHLGWIVDRHLWRALDQLPPIAAQLRSDRTVLAGDLNATPWSQELRGLDRALGLIRRDRATPTWPAQVLGRPWPLPFLPIDHVYAGKGWATVKVERGPWLGSDHYPLVITLAPVAPG